MKRERALRLLKAHLIEINQLGLKSLAVFGSVARDEAQASSDIDLLVELEPPYTFDRYIRAKFYLEDLLGCPVDLVMADALKPRAKVLAMQEAIFVA